MTKATPPKTAVLYRMVMPGHTCPYGLKSLSLLKRKGYAVEDHWLTTKEETEAFKAEHNVRTTPQTFIDGQRIGGNDDLHRHFGIELRDANAVSYVPVLAVFTVAALIALSASWAAFGTLASETTLRWFLAITTAILALLKLQDVESFSSMFLNYDVLARRWVPYSYIYPYAELMVGILMIAGVLWWVASPVAIFIGGVGAWSVFKAVYIEKRSIKCACVGGSSKVPLGFVSLTENLVMVAMGVWMLVAPMA